jgi:hypothetical protein
MQDTGGELPSNGGVPFFQFEIPLDEDGQRAKSDLLRGPTGPQAVKPYHSPRLVPLHLDLPRTSNCVCVCVRVCVCVCVCV